MASKLRQPRALGKKGTKGKKGNLRPSKRLESLGDPPGTVKWSPWYALIGLWLLLLAYQYYQVGNIETIGYSQFLDYLGEDRVVSVLIGEDNVRAEVKLPASEVKEESKATKNIIAYLAPDPELVKKLREKGVEFRGQPKSGTLSTILAWVFPIFLFFFLMRFLANRFGQGMQGGLLPFGKSRARVYVEKGVGTTFEDVAGVEEAKEELVEVVEFLRNPAEFQKLGGRAPKGILLVGPPGTGKTLLARAVAGEANVPFYSINGSEFVELFVGMGAARVRDLFDQARKNSPCIIFIDELDALGKSRTIAITGANDEKEQTLNQLLAELDGFDTRAGIILLAATNRPEILDPALLRSGRFDRQVLIDKPTRVGRLAILEIHCRKIRMDSEVNLEKIAGLTPGFSGADLENLANEAALVATRRKGKSVNEEDFVKAIERIIAGPERRTRVMNPEEKKRIAYHELGHVTVSLALEVQEKVQKVSVIPRGIGALGYTLQRPSEDRLLMTRKQLEHKISVLLGGRVSENLFFGESSTGSADDLTKATEIARAMVTQYSMSEKVGLPTFERPAFQYLPGELAPRTSLPASEATSEVIDSEVKSFLDSCQTQTCLLLEKHRKFIESSVDLLLQKETLDEHEITELWESHLRTLSS